MLSVRTVCNSAGGVAVGNSAGGVAVGNSAGGTNGS